MAPQKVICVGLNYHDHAEETGQPVPEEPILFPKFANSVIGDGADVVVPPVVTQPDFEAELGVVIGRRAHAVAEADALGHVAGYTCVNDVSARDLQFRSSQWMLGKAVDTFLAVRPLARHDGRGPGSASARGSAAWSTGKSCRTRPPGDGLRRATLVAFISRTITLEPGDIIATGTPPGVGMARTPPRWLYDGDR